ncbi:MAG: hypothetical protein ACRD98_01890 [Nitrososphaera sp.]
MPFGETEILDNFNRANETLTGNWTTAVGVGDVDLSVVNNEVAKEGAGNGSAWWNRDKFGPNCEAYTTVQTIGPVIGLNARITDAATAGVDYYQLEVNTATSKLWKRVNGAFTELASVTQVIASGDKVGIECIGTNILGYYRSSVGTWTAILSISSGTLSSAGFIGLEFNSTAIRCDDFGGGNTLITMRDALRRLGIGL